MRPQELASDTAKMVDVVVHAVSIVEAEEGRGMDWVMLLQPTAPLRERHDLMECVNMATTTDCDSVISVTQVFASHPVLMKTIKNGYLEPFCVEEVEGTRRQDYRPDAYMRNGAIYLTRRDVVMNQHSLWGSRICPYVMPEERSVSIDSHLDLELVRILLSRRQLSGRTSPT